MPTPALFLWATTIARIVFLMTKQSFSSLSSRLARRLPAANIRAKRADGRRYALDDKHYRDEPGLHGTIGAVFANFRAAHQ